MAELRNLERPGFFGKLLGKTLDRFGVPNGWQESSTTWADAVRNSANYISPYNVGEGGDLEPQTPRVATDFVESNKGLMERVGRSEPLPTDGIQAFGLSSGVAGLGRRLETYLDKRAAGAAQPKPNVAPATAYANADEKSAFAAGVANTLPMDQASRMARAREMGFDVDKTHYRGARSFDNLSGPTWVTDSPEYAANFPLRNKGETAIAPLHIRGKTLDLTKYPSTHGFDRDTFKEALGIRHRGVDDELDTLVGPMDETFEAYAALDLPGVQKHLNGYYGGVRVNQNVAGGGEAASTLVFDPRNIRSVNAAFDPAKADSANLLAANANEKAAFAAAGANADGVKPIRAYHGSDRGFDRFREPDDGGLYADMDVPHEGVWFSDDPARSEVFANAAFAKAKSRGDQEATGPAIYPSDLDFKNPYRHSAEEYADEGISSLPSEFELKQQGYDGAIVPRAEWEYVNDELTLVPLGTDYQALQPNTVRSATTGETLFANADEKAAALTMSAAERRQKAQALGHLETPFYHGTTHDIKPERGFQDPSGTVNKYSPESYHGRALYASTNETDANGNYAGTGPDLTSRISRLEDEYRDAPENWDRVDQADALWRARRLWREGKSEYDPAQYREPAMAFARAYGDLVGKNESGVTHKLSLNPQNPVRLGAFEGKPETTFEMSRHYVDNPEDGVYIVRDPEGGEVARYDDEGDAYDHADGIEPTGSGAKLLEEIDSWRYHYDVNDGRGLGELDSLKGQVGELMYDGRLKASELESILREHPFSQRMYDDPDRGIGPAIQDLYRSLGHDGVIMPNADGVFPAMGIPAGTTHAALFDNRRVRDYDNAAYDPDKKNSTNLLAANGSPFGAASQFLIPPIEQDEEQLGAFGQAPKR